MTCPHTGYGTLQLHGSVHAAYCPECEMEAEQRRIRKDDQAKRHHFPELLRAAFDPVLCERIPDDIRALIERLK